MAEKGHSGFWRGVLFLGGLGAAYFLWKQLDKAEEKVNALVKPDEPVVDVTAEEAALEQPEPEFEPAFLTPAPEEESTTTEADHDEFEARLRELEASLSQESPDDSGSEADDAPEPESEPEPVVEPEDAVIESEPENATIEPAPEPELDAVIEPEPEIELETVAAEDMIPQADEPGMPTIDESATPPAWVHPVDGQCPDGYPIKARFATGHLHEPGDRGYDKIVPDCCYPTVEAAVADGFTPSRWS
jgi:hypothetical protein